MGGRTLKIQAGWEAWTMLEHYDTEMNIWSSRSTASIEALRVCSIFIFPIGQCAVLVWTDFLSWLPFPFSRNQVPGLLPRENFHQFFEVLELRSDLFHELTVPAMDDGRERLPHPSADGCVLNWVVFLFHTFTA